MSKTTLRTRRGAISALAAFLLVVIVAMAAFTVDLGYLLVHQADLQRSADAAAHAAALEFRSEGEMSDIIPQVRIRASDYVLDNKVMHTLATVDMNSYNTDSNGDILVGKIDFENPRNSMTFSDIDEYNAVRVRIRRSDSRNGEVALFLARVLGCDSFALEAKSTAAVIHRVGGFSMPRPGEYVAFLPITVQEDYWESSLANGSDNWAIDLVNRTVSNGGDGAPEVSIYPSSTGSSGNFGTVNIGTSNNSTSHLGGQIRNGLSRDDLDFHGGELKLNNSGELHLTGDPGLSASIKDDLSAIRGRSVAIPLYRTVEGNGNNAVYTIVKFVGVRVMALRLTGNNKFVSVQPATVRMKNAVQATYGTGSPSEGIYSPPVIVQ